MLLSSEPAGTLGTSWTIINLKVPAFASASSLVGLDPESEDFFCRGRLQILLALWRLLISAVIVRISATTNTEMNGPGCVPKKKFTLQKQAVGRI